MNERHVLPLSVSLVNSSSRDDDFSAEPTTISDARHVKKPINLYSTLITATSNFSVQYNFQAISVALLVMSTTECTSDDGDCKEGTQAAWVTSTASATVFVGAIVGQLVMGYAGDVIGRNKAMLFTLSLASFGALFSSLLSFGSPEAVYSIIILCRFLLGVGLGGVYPLSAIKAAEDGATSDGKSDISGAGWSFFWQCPGAMGPWFLAYLMSFNSWSPNVKWRVLLGIGFVPGIIVALASFYDTSKIDKVLSESSSQINIIDYIKKPTTIKKLILTGGGWFMYDICYYGVLLFGGQILSDISAGDDDNISTDASIRNKSSQQLIALSCSIPGCILTILLFNRMGLKSLHIVGFLVISVSFILIAGLFDYLRDHSTDALFAVYCLLLFSLSFGPLVTTYVLPSQVYPKHVRGTLNGVSAACGKLGAVFGVYIFGSVSAATSLVVVSILCAVIAAIGAFVSYSLWNTVCAPEDDM